MHPLIRRGLPRGRPSWNVFVLIFLSVIGALVYGQSLGFGFFIFDDAVHITLNPRFRPVSPGNLWWIWTHSLMSVTYTFWAFLASLFGTANPVPYRVANLGLHILNSYLVFNWIRTVLEQLHKTGEQKKLTLAAFLAGFIFLAHPVHVENVAWISSTKDLLSFFFGMISFHFYFRSRKVIGDTFELKNVFWTYVFFLAAVLSKPAAAILPLLYIWLDRVLFARQVQKSMLEYSIAAIASAFAVHAYLRVVPMSNLGFVPDLGWRALLSLDALGFYLAKLLLPFEYYFDYGRTPLEVIRQFALNPAAQALTVIASSLVVAGFVLSYFRKNLQGVHVALGVIILGLLPYLGLIPFAFQNLSSVADRYLYFPSLGLSLAASLAYLHASRPRAALVIAGTFGIFLSIQTVLQTSTWKSSISVLSHSVARNPSSPHSRKALAHALFARGLVEEAMNEMKVLELLKAERLNESSNSE
ncbi:MAG: hypothetical protein A2X94_08065 [Bdellovibrionales bacterium GWB1_55_8]|nr:MAG: hypothetical protein A2X94_08065 [Bdellovibrionales bacterium GWB1_55_8]